MGDVNVYLLLTDGSLEGDVNRLITDVTRTNPRLKIKTNNNIKEARGSDFNKRMENMLTWAKCVVVVISDKFIQLIDKKDVSACPAVVASDAKNFQKVLKGFLEKQMKTIPNKLSLVSVGGSYDLPKMLKGMPVVENEGDFTTKVICAIEGTASVQG